MNIHEYIYEYVYVYIYICMLYSSYIYIVIYSNKLFENKEAEIGERIRTN